MHGQRVGAFIGAVGGLTFVLVNAGDLSSSLVAAVRWLGLLTFLFVLWRAVLKPPQQNLPNTRPSPSAWRVYWTCVLLGALALPVGATVLNRVLVQPQLTVLWVIFVVGAHFLPFARTFDAPIFKALAWTLMSLALVGTVLTLSVWPTAPSSIAVLAGFVLLASSLAGPRLEANVTRMPSH